MSLKPHVKAFLEVSPLAYLTTVEDLINYRSVSPDMLPPKVEKPQVPTENRAIPGLDGNIPIRIYTPPGEGPYPLLVFFHGGGFVVGDIESYDITCRILALKTGAKVISVDYRLAPEHPFPAGPEDCYAATKWVAEHAIELDGNPNNIVVGGDGAGGNLAAVVTLMAKEQRSLNISKQILIYPITDFHQHNVPSLYASYVENGEGYGVTSEHMDLCWKLYLKVKEERFHPYAAPLRASELSSLPPALVITAEYDVLRDEGEQYGTRLCEAGVPVTVKRFEGTIHGFLGFFPDQEEGLEALSLITDFIQEKSMAPIL